MSIKYIKSNNEHGYSTQPNDFRVFIDRIKSN